MPKPNKQIIIDALVQLIKSGNGYSKALGVNKSKWGLPPSTFDRHWKIAKEQHTAAQLVIKKELIALDIKAAIKVGKEALMSEEERKGILTQIARGEIEIPTSEVKWNPVDKVFETIDLIELPSHSARISAINEYNKMDGSHKPLKIAQTDREGNDVVTIFQLPDNGRNTIHPAPERIPDEGAK